MTFGNSILDFYSGLQAPPRKVLPPDVDLLWPFDQKPVKKVMNQFYEQYFGDNHIRTFLIGINPGRFGAGVTGLSFTDPDTLTRHLAIDHNLAGRRELSASFVYSMISHYGDPKQFYSRFYITSMSPAGFVKHGKNLNYYDVPGMQEQLDTWMAECMNQQLSAGGNRTLAFSMGQGTNYRQLQNFNRRHKFFQEIRPLPHPRWVMQYRRRKLQDYIELYIKELSAAARITGA